MERESLVGIRTMRDIMSGIGERKLKTTSSIYRTERAKESLIPSEDEQKLKELELLFCRERKRVKDQNEAIERIQTKLLSLRKKLVNLFDKNQRITELRRELQKKRYCQVEAPKKSTSKRFNQMNIQY